MVDKLKKVAEDGDVDELYRFLAEDPCLLDRIDQVPIANTLLHVAASVGKTHLAMEIATLKPSLARKLNYIGLSPMHLALRNGHIQTARGLITIDRELIRVKGRGRVTPLHWVAETGEINLLAEFLSVSPGSIEDMTVRCETAVHVAVKNYKSRAVEVLVGWLQRVNKEEILNWKDEDGNTALHIATSTGQPKAMKSLIKHMKVNAKNFFGLTAMDIHHLQGDLQNKDVGDILHRAKAKRASSLPRFATLADYLTQKPSILEKRDKYLGFNSSQSRRKSSGYTGNLILVVAVLIATATYQAALSPPGGYWQDDYYPTSNNNMNDATAINPSKGPRPHRAGDMIMEPKAIIYFFTLNSVAFYASVSTILIIIMGLPYSTTLYVSTCFFLFAYSTSLANNFPYPPEEKVKNIIVGIVYAHLSYIVTGLTVLITLVVVVRHRMHLRGRDDFLTRHLDDVV